MILSKGKADISKTGPKVNQLSRAPSVIIHKRIAKARKAFVHGYWLSFNEPLEVLDSHLKRLPYQEYGFAIEGIAMGLTLLDENEINKQHRVLEFMNGKTESEQLICSIGIGWAASKLEKPHWWSPPGLNRSLQPHVFDGFGFCSASEWHNGDVPLTVENPDHIFKTQFCIGVGRALWFLHNGNIESIRQSVRNMQVPAGNIWKGVATACAFTSNDHCIPRLIGQAKKYKSELLHGEQRGKLLLKQIKSIMI